jgi:protein-disulfide isomerase
MAVRAGVPNIAEFNRCSEAADSTVIARDVADARLVGARGTPTVILNGVVLNGKRDFETLDSLIRVEMAKAGSGAR